MSHSLRYKSLDFLRGVAVLMVMTAHGLPGYLSTHVGWTGVNLFFVLSGFFVSGLLFREHRESGKIHAGRFFIRRIFKIWPLFYTAFVVQFLYFTFKHTPPHSSATLAEIFFFQNYRPGFMQVTWSLAIEEQFYFIIAIALPLITLYGKVTWIVPGCILIMIVSLSLRVIHYFSFAHYDPYTHHYPLQFQADSLSAGILISWYYHFQFERFKHWVSKKKVLLLILSIILLAPIFIFPYYDEWTFTIGLTSIWMGYSGIVMLLVILPAEQKKWNDFFHTKPALVIAWIGFYSYAIYLFHVFIGAGALSNFRKYCWMQAPLAVQFLVFLAVDIFFGYFISKLIEQPILRWRNRNLPSKGQVNMQPKKPGTTKTFQDSN